jgi:hypothetical protein
MLDKREWVGLLRELDGVDSQHVSILNVIHKPIKDKTKVLEYMKHSETIAACPSIIKDILDPNVHLASHYVMGDTKYQWNSYVIYYVEKYDMALPDDFIEHVLAQPSYPRDVKYNGSLDPNTVYRTKLVKEA